VFRKARREFADHPMDLRDGVKVTLADAWFLLRGSNTEPVMRVVAEAATEDAARSLALRIRSRVDEWLA
jgi:phosphomannomutase